MTRRCRYTRVLLLALIATSMLWLLAENISAFMRLHSDVAGRPLDAVEAQQAFGEYWHGRPAPVRAGDDFFALASGEIGFQAPSVITGLAIRELAQGESVDYVVVPDYDIESRPRLIISVVDDLTWGSTHVRTYDPVIEDEVFEGLRAQGRVRQLPLGVYVLEPQESPATGYTIHTDPSGELIYIVPATGNPEGDPSP